MSSQREVWAREVAGALEAHAEAVVQMAPGRWAFALRSSSLSVAAQLGDEWLVMDVPLGAAAAGRCADGWRVLTANASLPGGWKLCAGHADGALRLRAELPLADDTPRGVRVHHLCTGLVAAVRWLGAPEDARPSAPVPLVEPGAAAPDLEALCRAAAWPFTVRAPDTVMVPLAVPGFQQATVQVQPARGVTVSVPVLSAAPQTPVGAAAAARLLLTASGLVRMVRAVAADAPAAVSLEVVFAHRPQADELAHAFAALSVAWTSVAHEAEALARDAQLAELYLAGSATHQDAGGLTA